MFPYFILLLGTLLICTFSIHDRLRQLQRTQEFHSQWLQELLLTTTDPMVYRRLFQTGGELPKEVNPAMLKPYISVMSEQQNNRYRQWLLGISHEQFTPDEIRELEKSLNIIEQAK